MGLLSWISELVESLQLPGTMLSYFKEDRKKILKIIDRYGQSFDLKRNKATFCWTLASPSPAPTLPSVTRATARSEKQRNIFENQIRFRPPTILHCVLKSWKSWKLDLDFSGLDWWMLCTGRIWTWTAFVRWDLSWETMDKVWKRWSCLNSAAIKKATSVGCIKPALFAETPRPVPTLSASEQ